MPPLKNRLVVIFIFVVISAAGAGFGLGSLNNALVGGIVGLVIGVIVSLNNFIRWALSERPGLLIGVAVLVIVFTFGILIVKTGVLWCNPASSWYQLLCS